MARSLILFYLLLWNCFLFGAEPSKPVNFPDYSSAFKQLIDLGLPTIPANSQWVTATPPEKKASETELSDERRNEYSSYSSEYGGEFESLKGFNHKFIKITPKGNAWCPPNTQTQSAIPSGTGRAAIPYAKITPQNLESDIKELIKQINSRKIKDARYTSPAEGNDPSYLILATELFQTGHVDLANELAYHLFNRSPHKDYPIKEVITYLASQEYQTIYLEFAKNHDLAKYQASLTKHCQKFPRGWSQIEEAQNVLAQLNKQLSTPPSIPSLPSITLTPSQITWCQKLMTPQFYLNLPQDSFQLPSRYRDDGDHSDLPTNWILLPSARSKHPQISEIQSLGIEALPTLISLLSDHSLTPACPPFNRPLNTYIASDDERNSSSDNWELSFQSPMPRAQIALSLLLPVIPYNDRRYGSSILENLRNIQEFQLYALAFYQQYKKSPDELVFAYLHSPTHAEDAINTIVQSNNPALIEKFESKILNCPLAIVYFNTVKTYLSLRKNQTGDFCKRYCDLILNQPQPDFSNLDYESDLYAIKDIGSVKKAVDTLIKLSNKKNIENPIESLNEWVNELATSEEEQSPNINELSQILKKIKDPNIAPLIILKAVDSTRNTRNAIELADTSLYLRFNHDERSDRISGPIKGTLTPEEISEWKKLLSKHTSPDNQDRASLFVDSMISYGLIYRLDPAIIPFLKVSPTDYKIDCALQYLNLAPTESVSGPYIPTPTPQRAGEIIQSLIKATPREWSSILSNLNANEVNFVASFNQHQYRLLSYSESEREQLDQSESNTNPSPSTSTVPDQFFSTTTSITALSPNPLPIKNILETGKQYSIQDLIAATKSLHSSTDSNSTSFLDHSPTSLGVAITYDSRPFNQKSEQLLKESRKFDWESMDPYVLNLDFSNNLLARISNEDQLQIQTTATFLLTRVGLYMITGTEPNITIKSLTNSKKDEQISSFSDLEKLFLTESTNPNTNSTHSLKPISAKIITIGADAANKIIQNLKDNP